MVVILNFGVTAESLEEPGKHSLLILEPELLIIKTGIALTIFSNVLGD